MLFHLLHYLTDLAAVPDGDALALLRNLTGTAYGTARPVRLLRRPGQRRDRRVVEPGMTFITPGMAAAGIKATGSVASALIGRYRPTGVPGWAATRTARRRTGGCWTPPPARSATPTNSPTFGVRPGGRRTRCY